MAVTALGYIGVRSDKLDDWADFAGKLLGMQKIDRGPGALAFRMDDKAQRLIVTAKPGETLAFMGWEVEHRADLDAYAARLEAAGARVRHAMRRTSDGSSRSRVAASGARNCSTATSPSASRTPPSTS